VSSYLAIAAATRSLRNLLNDRLEEAAAVTLAPPDVQVTGVDGRRVNLYLIDTREARLLSNQIPADRVNAGSAAPIPLSLELTYLVTAYAGNEKAADADLDAQVLLGDVLRVFNECKVLDRNLHEDGDPARARILDEVLLDAREPLKITLLHAGAEDISQLWFSLPETNFRRSLLYRVSLVQIESARSMLVAPPVLRTRLRVEPGGPPEIVAVSRASAPAGRDPRVAIGDTLVITGQRFAARRAWVRLGELEPMAVDTSVPDRFTIVVPDDIYPANADQPAPRPIPAELRLRAGPVPVSVEIEPASSVEVRLDPGERRLRTSNRAFFTLLPSIGAVSPESGSAASVVLRVTGKRLFDERAESQLLIGDQSVPVRAPSASETFEPPAPDAIDVPLAPLAHLLPVPPVGGRTYRVRVLSNGALNPEDTFSFTLFP
jgi:hypothetical protein